MRLTLRGRARYLVSCAVAVVLLAGCEPENLVRPLPLFVEQASPDVLVITAPVCEGEFILSTWVRSEGRDHRSARWLERPAVELARRLVELEYSPETLEHATFNRTETVPEPVDFESTFGGLGDVRGIWVRTSRGTEGVVLADLAAAGPGPWVIRDDAVRPVAAGFDPETLLEGWCDDDAG